MNPEIFLLSTFHKTYVMIYKIVNHRDKHGKVDETCGVCKRAWYF